MRAHLWNPSFFRFPTACLLILFLAISNVHSAVFYGQIEEGAPDWNCCRWLSFSSGRQMQRIKLGCTQTVLTDEDSSYFHLNIWTTQNSF